MFVRRSFFFRVVFLKMLMLLSECMVVCLNEKVFIFSGFFESILYDNKESKEMFTYHIIIMTELEFLEKNFFFVIYIII